MEYTVKRRASDRELQFTYLLIAAVCCSLCAEKSTESLAGSAGSGRKRRPQIEQAYSPVHTLLPSRIDMTAFRQIFLTGMLKAYTGSGSATGEKVPHLRGSNCSCQWNFTVRFVKITAVCQTNRRSLRIVMGV